MPRDTLLDFFEDFSRQDDPFVVHDDGYRVRQVTYGQMGAAARRFAAWLHARGIVAGDKIVLWSENRPEWIAALWGALLRRVVVVPIDYRGSGTMLDRVTRIVEAKGIFVGDEVTPPDRAPAPVFRLAEEVSFEEAARTPESRNRTRNPEPRTPEPPAASTLAEIIFTSGATSEPKGVTITHRNVVANLAPIEREIAKYRKYEKPFHPIRFLNLLPLSHMFGQSMAAFIPPMIGGTVVFSRGLGPGDMVHQIKSRRISVLVCVPKALDVLAVHVRRLSPRAAADENGARGGWLRRWWYYRDVHRLFGWKFWCVVVGAAPLDPGLEAFWRRLGFLVVQGYGLTETAPIVTLNHPFHAARGTVGKPIAGVDVRIAPDGEILVRGENVTSGYYRPGGGASAGEAFEDGWFHTGDVGEMDASGQLVIKGRKKEMIATAQGLNVFPEDVERALLAQPGVQDAGVVGRSAGGEERVHAVLVLAPGADADAAIRGANAQLDDYQRIWSRSVWPGEALPRTEGTQKLRRRELQRWVEGAPTPATGAASGSAVEDVVSRFAGGRSVRADTTLDELGLSSLDRVELTMALEEACHVTIDETRLADAKTVGELKALCEGSGGSGGSGRSESGEPRGAATGRVAAPLVFPRWNRSGVARFLRRVSLPTWILPLGRVFMSLKVEGLEHLRDLDGPVVFAANHQSHLDTPAILSALPPRWRYALAPAMAKEFFHSHFNRREAGLWKWSWNTLGYVLASLFFNAFPLPQREAGARQTLRYIGEIASRGGSILIFPEGKRSQDGEIGPFRPGVGMIGSRLELAVVPVRIEGLDKVLDPSMRFPRRGPVHVAFGPPIHLTGDDYGQNAARVEEAVRRL